MVPVSPLLARTGTVCTAAVDAIRARENRTKRLQIMVKKVIKEEVKKEVIEGVKKKKNSGAADSARTRDAHNLDSDHGTDPGSDSDSDADSEDELFLYLSQNAAEINSSD
jgi:hypothetical protein